jgi:hypothetical protein
MVAVISGCLALQQGKSRQKLLHMQVRVKVFSAVPAFITFWVSNKGKTVLTVHTNFVNPTL